MIGRATASLSETSLGSTVIKFRSKTTISVMGCLAIPTTFQWGEYNQVREDGVEGLTYFTRGGKILHVGSHMRYFPDESYRWLFC